MFRKLKDIEIFTRSCTVVNGTLGWDISENHDISEFLDLDPDNLYINCKDVAEPDIRLYN